MIVAAGALIAFAAPARAQSGGDGLPLAPAAEAPAADERSVNGADSSGPIAAAPSLVPAPRPERAPRPSAGASESTKPARVPLAKRWWFWASLGTAAVGVVLAAIFLGPRDPYNGNANPGPGTVFTF